MPNTAPVGRSISSNPFRSHPRAIRHLGPVLTNSPRRSAIDTKRRDLAVRTQRRHRHRLQKPQQSQRSVPTGPLANATGAFPHAKRFQPHRKPFLQNFGIGGPRICHMRLHCITAIKPRPRASPAGNRLIILKRLIAPDENCSSLPESTPSRPAPHKAHCMSPD